MATELKDEVNSADVWEKIAKVLQSSDLTLLRILRDWQKFFRLRCDTLEEFPQFYSDLRKITSDLQTAKSIAVGDDAFIKAFLSGAISVKELSQTTKEFLNGGKKKYTDIMDEIQVDYNLMNSCNTLQDNAKPTKSQLRRAKNTDLPPSSYVAPTKAHSQTQGSTKLPPNTGNLIPNAYYKQFKGWYEASRVPAKDRSEEQINYLSSFVWKHTVDPKAKRPWSAPTGRKKEYQRNTDRCSSRRGRGRNRRDRSESSESSSDDSGSRRRHSSRRGRKRRSYSSDSSPSRSRSPGARRGQEGDSKKGSSKTSRRSSLFKRDP